MNNNVHPRNEFWSGRLIFILAVAGATIGLGNIWRFPYMVSEYGGGLFVLIYLFFVLVIGAPVMIAEIMVGRMGGQSPVSSIRITAEQSGQSRHWQIVGWMAMIAGVLILSFYSVIAGWALAYLFRMASGVFSGVTVEGVTAILSGFISDPEKLLAWHTIFICLIYAFVIRGLRGGIEWGIRIFMPLLLVLLMVLLAYAVGTGFFEEGMKRLFFADTSKLENIGDLGLIMVAAMAQAFFTLALGTGAIMMYGAYLPKSISITGTVLTIVVLDTLIAVIAGMIIFPLVFATNLESVTFLNGLDGRYGPGLIFQTMPLVFGHMDTGTFFGALFFLVIVIAAWASAISLVEPPVAYLGERWSISRTRATAIVSIVAWLLGIGTIFSFNIWSELRPLGFMALFEAKTIYHLFDLLASNILLPVGGILVVIFTGWILDWKATEDELAMGQEYCGFAIWRFMVRYISPVLLFIVFIYSLVKAFEQSVA